MTIEIIKIRTEINRKEMKETKVKINKTTIWLFKIKLQIISQTHQEKKGRRLKSTKLEMKMKKSQQTT